MKSTKTIKPIVSENLVAIPKKKGRKSSGLPPEVVQRQSTDRRRKKLLDEGKVRFDDFVLPETRDGIRLIKTVTEAHTLGEALDIIVKNELRRRKLDTVK
ncbi:MAG: hypothetical protein Q7K26_00535 [bacterium]|nr:hypothetical protein [bacterium]